MRSVFLKRHAKVVIVIWVALLLSNVVWRLPHIQKSWKKTKGYEYFWIAESMAKGHGFSFDSRHRWLFSNSKTSYNSDNYYPTAWEEPIYPILMALKLKTLGKDGKLAIVIFQTISLFFTSIFVLLIGQKAFNLETGLLAGLIVSILPASRMLAEWHLVPAIFAGLTICCSAYLIFHCLDKSSVRRGIAGGLMLGFTCLTYAPTLLFIPLSFFFILFYGDPSTSITRRTALSVLLAACFIMLPWTIRNLATFGHFIPVKNGLGKISHVSNPILAATFSSGLYACSDSLGPLWKARNAKEAVWLSSQDREKRLQLDKRSSECVEKEAPAGYERFNEAERDKVYLKKTLQFIVSEPKVFLLLAYHRLRAFFLGWRRSQTLISVLALMGALVAFRNQRARILVLFGLGYTAPYLLATPYFYRYRYPIDPILILFSAHFLTFVIQYPIKRLRVFAGDTMIGQATKRHKNLNL